MDPYCPCSCCCRTCACEQVSGAVVEASWFVVVVGGIDSVVASGWGCVVGSDVGVTFDYYYYYCCDVVADDGDDVVDDGDYGVDYGVGCGVAGNDDVAGHDGSDVDVAEFVVVAAVAVC